MKVTNTERYQRGMQAINNFYAMLFKAIKEGLPSAQFSGNGAYFWRGYQINQYEDLAYNQYYFQINPGEPFTGTSIQKNFSSFSCRQLVFKEAYKDPKYIPLDEFEEVSGISTGVYHYPFRILLDLYQSRFFLLSVEEQYLLLKNFITYAAQQAKVWQHSATRTSGTNPDFLSGGNPHRSKKSSSRNYQKVDMDFLHAWGMQDALFTRLKTQLTPYRPQNARTEKDWIRVNASHHNFAFRGLRMTSEKISQGKNFDYRWLIFFDKPECLGFYTSHNEFIDGYDITDNQYFDLPAAQQDEQLARFVKRCIDRY